MTTPEMSSVQVERIQLDLADIGRAFKKVLLTDEGCFQAPCPVDTRHHLLIRLADSGHFVIICPLCDRLPATAERLANALNRCLPGWGIEAVLQAQPAPVTGWVRQPAGAPAVALRQLSDHSIEFLADAGQEAAARSWLEASGRDR